MQVYLETVFKHGGTLVFFVAEYLLSRAPVASYWFQFPFIYSSIYAVFMWLHWGIAHWWVYGVFDWRKSDSIAYYLVMPLLVAAGFSFVCASNACVSKAVFQK